MAGTRDEVPVRGEAVDAADFALGAHLVYDEQAKLWFNVDTGGLHRDLHGPALSTAEGETVKLEADSPILAHFQRIDHDNESDQDSVTLHLDTMLLQQDDSIVGMQPDSVGFVSADVEVLSHFGRQGSMIYHEPSNTWIDNDGKAVDGVDHIIEIEDRHDLFVAFRAGGELGGIQPGKPGDEVNRGTIDETLEEVLDTFDGTPLVFDVRTQTFSTISAEDLEQRVAMLPQDGDLTPDELERTVLGQTSLNGDPRDYARFEVDQADLAGDEQLGVRPTPGTVHLDRTTGAFRQFNQVPAPNTNHAERPVEGLVVNASSPLGRHLQALNGNVEPGEEYSGDLLIDAETGLVYTLGADDKPLAIFGAVAATDHEDSDAISRLVQLDGGVDGAVTFGNSNELDSRFLDPRTGLVVDAAGEPVDNDALFISHEEYVRNRIHSTQGEAPDDLKGLEELGYDVLEGHVVDLRTGAILRNEDPNAVGADGEPIDLLEVTADRIYDDDSARFGARAEAERNYRGQIEQALDQAALNVNDEYTRDEREGLLFNETTGTFHREFGGPAIDEPIELHPSSELLQAAGLSDAPGPVTIDPTTRILTFEDRGERMFAGQIGEQTIVHTPDGELFDLSTEQFIDAEGEALENQNRYTTVNDLLEDLEPAQRRHMLHDLGLIDERGEPLDRLEDGTPTGSLIIDRLDEDGDGRPVILTLNPEEWRVIQDGRYVNTETGEHVDPEKLHERVVNNGEDLIPVDTTPEEESTPEEPSTEPAAEQDAPDAEPAADAAPPAEEGDEPDLDLDNGEVEFFTDPATGQESASGRFVDPDTGDEFFVDQDTGLFVNPQTGERFSVDPATGERTIIEPAPTPPPDPAAEDSGAEDDGPDMPEPEEPAAEPEPAANGGNDDGDEFYGDAYQPDTNYFDDGASTAYFDDGASTAYFDDGGGAYFDDAVSAGAYFDDGSGTWVQPAADPAPTNDPAPADASFGGADAAAAAATTTAAAAAATAAAEQVVTAAEQAAAEHQAAVLDLFEQEGFGQGVADPAPEAQAAPDAAGGDNFGAGAADPGVVDPAADMAAAHDPADFGAGATADPVLDPATPADNFGGMDDVAEVAVLEEPEVFDLPADEPVFEEPAFEEPAFEEPAFEEPAFEEPAFEEPPADAGFDE